MVSDEPSLSSLHRIAENKEINHCLAFNNALFSFVYSKVSVIRGTVLLRDGSPALGTRVEVIEQREAGFTLTRQNGT